MNKKKWIKDGVIWNGRDSIIVGDFRVFNPTDEMLIEAGFEEYIEPAPSDEQKLNIAKSKKIVDLEVYDQSSAVNGFYLGEQEMWLTVDERQQIATQISANEAVGRDNMTKWFNGQSYTFPIPSWKQMLVALEVYAGDALNVTESHKAAINALDDINAVEEYDFTNGYPEKLNF